MGVMSMDYY